MKIIKFSNSIDPNEVNVVAHSEPPLLDLHCLCLASLSYEYDIAYMKGCR